MRAGVSMWLKDHGQACLRPDRPGSPQRLADLLGMVAIIVHDRHAVAYPPQIKTSLHTTKLSQSLCHGRERDVQFRTDGNSGQSVGDIVRTRQIERARSEPLTGPIDLKA